jgi:hypothetical protein
MLSLFSDQGRAFGHETSTKSFGEYIIADDWRIHANLSALEQICNFKTLQGAMFFFKYPYSASFCGFKNSL